MPSSTSDITDARARDVVLESVEVEIPEPAAVS